MSITTTSSLSTSQTLIAQLQAQDKSLNQLSTQLATNQVYSNLTDYAPTDALNLLNLQENVAQKQSYLSVINTLQTRMTGYNTTMSDIESVVSQAQNLTQANGNYSVSAAANIASLSTSFLQSVGIDLNQQIDGRYIYAGSRYSTPPVTNLATMTTTPTSTIQSNSQTLPDYDVGNVTLATSGQTITVGGTIAGSASIPQSTTITINGTPYTYTIPSADTTATQAATDIAANLATQTGLAVTASGGVITVPVSNTINAATSTTNNSSAYTVESAPIDSGNTINYGVTSNNPAFQQIIAGLRFMQAAGNSGNAATYQSDISQASTLLASGLAALQTVNSGVAFNINALTTEQTNQNSAINDLTTQIDNIQQVDIAQVSTEITALEAQLQASYSVTGTIEKLSIVNYL